VDVDAGLPLRTLEAPEGSDKVAAQELVED
jgi:hypothetical protein